MNTHQVTTDQVMIFMASDDSIPPAGRWVEMCEAFTEDGCQVKWLVVAHLPDEYRVSCQYPAGEGEIHVIYQGNVLTRAVGVYNGLFKQKPVHEITVQDVLLYCKKRWDNMASATTADSSQRKNLDVKINEEGYRVQRRVYFGPEGGWETLYEGGNLEEAVRLYNQLG